MTTPLPYAVLIDGQHLKWYGTLIDAHGAYQKAKQHRTDVVLLKRMVVADTDGHPIGELD